MKRLSIAVCFAFLGATPAAAEKWVRVGGDDKAAEFVDAESIRRVGDEVRFKREMRFASVRPEGFDRMAFASVASCRGRTAAVLSMSFLLQDHELMSSKFREAGPPTDPAVPGTALGRALAYACDGALER